ncbi:MAG: hypothetical protein IKN50_05320 [Clostridia bacterium]|nr:hypothetical protein [Clostridia bacterium]
MKIKKIVSIIAALSLAAAVFSGCSKKDPSVPDGMKLASDPELATYTFFVPESWSIDTQNASTRAYCSGTDRSFIMVMTGEMQYTDSTVDNWWESGLAELKALYRNFELSVEGEETKLGGADAKRYVYSGDFDETSFKYSQVAAIKSGVIYIITYGATADKWDSHLDEVKMMIENFRFGK